MHCTTKNIFWWGPTDPTYAALPPVCHEAESWSRKMIILLL